VAPEAQGRGAGRALLEGAAAVARSAGKARLTLGTMPEMAAARHLYDRLGFREGPPLELPSGQCRLTYEMALEALPPSG